MKALIFANGDLRTPYNIKEILASAELTIVADGGARHCKVLGIKPDALIGDFDSLEEIEVKEYKKEGVKIIRHPVRKDTTDLELAVDYAFGQGAVEIIVLGAIGDRFDHTLANVLLMTYSQFSNCSITFLNGEEEIFLLKKNLNTLYGKKGDIVSLIPLCDVSGMTTEGLEYPLTHENLHTGTSRGVSNVFIDTSARVSFTSGLLLCIIHRSSDTA